MRNVLRQTHPCNALIAPPCDMHRQHDCADPGLLLSASCMLDMLRCALKSHVGIRFLQSRCHACSGRQAGWLCGGSVCNRRSFDCDQLHSAPLSFALVPLSCPFKYLLVQSHLLTASMDLAQVSICVNNLLVVREYRKVFQLCEQPQVCCMSSAVIGALTAAVMCLLVLSSSSHTRVRPASVTLQLQTWLGLAPNQVVTAVLVIVMVSWPQCTLHSVVQLLSISTQAQARCCWSDAVCLPSTGNLLHATECFGSEPASQGWCHRTKLAATFEPGF